jgi:hypothetical protein
VSDLQAFTAAHVPTPSWVLKSVVTVPDYNVDRAAELLTTALEMDPRTMELVGGKKWWTMRGRALTGEWIEVSSSSTLPLLQQLQARLRRPLRDRQMKKDKLKRGAAPPERVLLYLHGTFFLSTRALYAFILNSRFCEQEEPISSVLVSVCDLSLRV